jgi:pilus assembly protein CpaE
VIEDRQEDQRKTLRVTLVTDSPECKKEVKEALSGVAEPSLEVIDRAPEQRAEPSASPNPADVALVVFNGNEGASLEYLRHQAAQSPRPVVFAVLKERSAGLMKRVIRAGADELLFTPIDVGELTGALLKIREARWRAERAHGGTIISAVSLAGGCGVTSLCINLGLAFRYALDKRVALVDLDLQAGALSVMLNLEPETTMLALARSDRKLDSLQIESILAKHPSGLYVLAAPKRLEEGESVSDAMVGAALDMLREMFDVVIVDCGDHIGENTVAAWERSDQLFYVLGQSVTSVRSAWRFVDLFERLNVSTLEPRFVLNRYVASHAIDEKRLQDTLGREIYMTIPRDDRAMERAELEGRDLFDVAGGSALARSYEALARQLSPAPEAIHAASGGFMTRLLAAFGGRA